MRLDKHIYWHLHKLDTYHYWLAQLPGMIFDFLVEGRCFAVITGHDYLF